MRTIATIAAVVLVASCASSPPPPVKLADTWPQAAGVYDDIYQRWTRRGLDRDEMIQTLTVSATLESAEFRAAYVHERAVHLQLPADDEARLAEDERKALADGWDVELLVATAKPEWNDLRNYGKDAKTGKLGSMWRIALVGDGGREVTPVTIKQDRRHREDVQHYFPDLKAFYEPYIVHFPKAAADGRPLIGERGKLALKVGGSLGQVQLVWASD